MTKGAIVARGIVSGQHVSQTKAERARTLRRGMTPAERALWAALRGNRLSGAHFRRQQVIDGFIVDFYCHAASLVIEVDGGVHRRQADYDAARDQALAARGLRIRRIANDDITHDLNAVLEQIRVYLTQVDVEGKGRPAAERPLPQPLP